MTAHSPRSNRRPHKLGHRPLYNVRRRVPRAYNPCRSDALDPQRPGTTLDHTSAIAQSQTAVGSNLIALSKALRGLREPIDEASKTKLDL
jgi:hypothetical protein